MADMRSQTQMGARVKVNDRYNTVS